MNPYENLPEISYWKTGVVSCPANEIDMKQQFKFQLNKSSKIMTAGSCFAQHIANYLRSNGLFTLDYEQPPECINEDTAKQLGYMIYSARYGNIYTARHFLQLAREAFGEKVPNDRVWEKDGRYYDAQRPQIQPGGYHSKEEVIEHRELHLRRVKQLFLDMDILIFTLGLTECWQLSDCSTVFPTAPGVLAGSYDPGKYTFKNLDCFDIVSDIDELNAYLQKKRNRPFNILLTVSPVSLTATASGKHILYANTYSKATLRAAAGILENRPNIDYYCSYEIITNPASSCSFFNENLRTVRSEGVTVAMKSFGKSANIAIDDGIQHLALNGTHLVSPVVEDEDDDVVCEDALLEAFFSKDTE